MKGTTRCSAAICTWCQQDLGLGLPMWSPLVGRRSNCTHNYIFPFGSLYSQKITCSEWRVFEARRWPMNSHTLAEINYLPKHLAHFRPSRVLLAVLAACLSFLALLSHAILTLASSLSPPPSLVSSLHGQTSMDNVSKICYNSDSQATPRVLAN